MNASNLLPLRVLVVEDDPAQQLLTGMVLERIGITDFTTASSTAEALTRLNALSDRDWQYHLVLTDFNMPPGADGLELIKTIRADFRLRHLKIIMVTSEDNLNLQSELRRHLAGYLKKTKLTKATLLEVIQQQLLPH